jgi:hypothetical protein
MLSLLTVLVREVARRWLFYIHSFMRFPFSLRYVHGHVLGTESNLSFWCFIISTCGSHKLVTYCEDEVQSKNSTFPKERQWCRIFFSYYCSFQPIISPAKLHTLLSTSLMHAGFSLSQHNVRTSVLRWGFTLHLALVWTKVKKSAFSVLKRW